MSGYADHLDYSQDFFNQMEIFQELYYFHKHTEGFNYMSSTIEIPDNMFAKYFFFEILWENKISPTCTRLVE